MQEFLPEPNRNNETAGDVFASDPVPPPLPPGDLHQLPPDRSRPSATAGHHHRAVLARVVWLLSLVVLLVVLKYWLPEIAERYHYAVNRGRMRAEYEAADAALRDKPLEQLSLASQMVNQRVAPSVAHIRVLSTRASDRQEPDDFSYFFNPRLREAHGQGSGVIVDSQGYVLTNYHVVEGAETIEVTLSDRQKVKGRVVGHDPLTDLAVLKIEAGNLVAAEWGDSNAARVGSLVWAVGSPFGLEQTITSGILSAKNRAERAGSVYQNFLQTDAAVNPGNSGGPLVDDQGRVIGINTAIVGQAYQGISFAIPSSIARDVYERIRREGRVAYGWLGIGMEEITEERAAQLGVPQGKGVYVIAVVQGAAGPSPAYVAGIREGDVVLRWNDLEIESSTALKSEVGATEVGSKVAVEIVRDRRRIQLEVVVGERPSGLN